MRKLRALVVDDSLTVRMDLRGTLSKAGFLVSACSTRGMALSALGSGAFDVVVLDVHLPDGSGIEILKVLKTDPQLKGVAVIMLTTEAEVRARINGLALGADLYVGKPYDRVYVARMARELCQVRGHEDASAPRRVMSCKKLLLVGASEPFQHAMAEELRQDGHDVVLSRSAQEALELLAIESLACVVIEMELREVSGLEVCRCLRQIPRAQLTPVLLVGSHLDQGLREQALAAGADGFMYKTADLEVLRAWVRSLLIRRRSEQAISRALP